MEDRQTPNLKAAGSSPARDSFEKPYIILPKKLINCTIQITKPCIESDRVLEEQLN